MKHLSYLVVIVSVLALAGCGSSGTTSSGGGGGTQTLTGLASCDAVAGQAVVCGTAYATDGVTPLVNAEVTQVVSGSENVPLRGMYKLTPNNEECLTDATGAFACGGITASGSYTLQISGQGYTFTFSIALTVDEATTAPAADTTAEEGDSTEVKWLVVHGAFDGVQLLLSQLKGCTLTGIETYSEYPQYLTGSEDCETAGLYVVEYENIAETFSAVANLTTYDSIFVNCGTNMSDYATVLQEYVAQGGNLYFSDLADEGLTAAFPDNVDFGTNDTNIGTITGTVDYAELATYLGGSTVELVFDLGSWQAIDSVEDNVTIYISGDESSLGGPADAPITVGWKEGSGGCIFYTSYHIEGASTGADQELALKYLVLNIGYVCQ